MLIGIIGAGISGLTAGRLLAKAGHEVRIFEKSRGYGGRLATRYDEDNHEIRFDHGTPHFSGTDPRFQGFIDELTQKNILKKWAETFNYWDGKNLQSMHPEKVSTNYYYAPEGLNTIGKYLSRWSDVHTESKVIGITYLGAKNDKKRAWMLNFENFETVEVDAVIVATPAVQAYGLIMNSQDETIFRSVISKIDEISYNPKYSLMLTYDDAPKPDWKGIFCNDDTIHWISNESSKRDNAGKTTLVCHSKGEFTRDHILNSGDLTIIKNEMILRLRTIIGDWAGKYDQSQIHLWRYSQPRTFLDRDYVEIGVDNAPVAIIGDYMRSGGTVEQAYISGIELANDWAEKLPR